MARIDHITSISQKDATRLRRSGVRTTEALLRRAASRSDRATFSRETDIASAMLLRWVKYADLMRVRGVGGDYAELLVACGVDTVKELRRRNPVALAMRLLEINERKKLVARLPTQETVTGWIEHAQKLDPLVRH